MLNSCKIEKLGFAMFYNETYIKENFRHDVVATE